jgi:hypothetical protein
MAKLQNYKFQDFRKNNFTKTKKRFCFVKYLYLYRPFLGQFFKPILIKITIKTNICFESYLFQQLLLFQQT